MNVNFNSRFNMQGARQARTQVQHFQKSLSLQDRLKALDGDTPVLPNYNDPVVEQTIEDNDTPL